MLHCRQFRNSDPPLLAELWRSRADRHGLVQPLSTAALDQYVLARSYFDRRGLILAWQDDALVGFVHAGFGVAADRKNLATERGIVSLLLVRHGSAEDEVAARLLDEGENYLRQSGVREIVAGGVQPDCPFYLGLYGGSQPPGLLDSEPQVQQWFLQRGYTMSERTTIYRRELAGFRPPLDRQQMQIRRSTQTGLVDDPPAADWWEACTQGYLDRVRFDLLSRPAGRVEASVLFWDMQSLLPGSSGVHTAGLLDLQVAGAQRRRGWGVYLVADALRHLHAQGFARVETLTRSTETAAAALFQKLGFKAIDGGTVLKKML